MKRSISQILGVALILIANMAFAANEIKFQKGTSIVSSRYGQSSQGITFEVTVANLAVNKQVYARLNLPNNAWVDVPLSFNRSLNGNREVWRGNYQRPLNTVLDAVFALKYVVNGQTYWDNNGGQNYTIASDSGNLLASGVNVYHSNYASSVTMPITSNAFWGGVTVRNLNPTKIVRVHYTTDNWATTSIANAYFNAFVWSGAYSSASNPNQYGSEEWVFNLDVGYTSTEVKYAIEYVVNGQTYWDNNSGLNYQTAIVRQ